MDAPRHEPRVDRRIERSATLPGSFYTDGAVYERLRDTLFARSWQWIGTLSDAPAPGRAVPLVVLPGLLDEPIVLARDEDGDLAAFSNVCTHRARIVLDAPGPSRRLVCRYHGRTFDAAGRCKSVPGFEGAEDVPSPADDLPRVHLEELFGHLFVSLDPEVSFDEWVGPLRERFAWLPIDSFREDAARARDYPVAAHWGLYVDNYLEGFHIPTVHPELARAVETTSYRNELFPHATLQTGFAREGELAFSLPDGAPDSGQRVAGYYAWLFPNTMFNLYPWGLSLNVVHPYGPRDTRVLYRAFVGNAELSADGAGGALELVERQDEDVVESVQRGIESRLYRSGRFAPAHEVGVHRFHLRLQSYRTST